MSVTDPNFNPSADPAVEQIKQMGLELEEYIVQNVANGRRRAIALTHLETCLMYAVKARVVGNE